MSVVSPSPSLSTSESSDRLAGGPLEDDEILGNMTAMIACLSDTPGHHSIKGILGSHHNRDSESPSLSYREDDWGGTETRNDWTIGDVSRHNDDSKGFNYNNYHVEGPHNSDSFDLSSINRALSGFRGTTNDDGEDSVGETFCPRDWDDILCWPKTATGEIATLPCFENLRGIPYNASGELVLNP